MANPLMTREQAAAYLGISKEYFSALNNHFDANIPYITLQPDGRGRRFYRLQDLDSWLDTQVELHKARG